MNWLTTDDASANRMEIGRYERTIHSHSPSSGRSNKDGRKCSIKMKIDDGQMMFASTSRRARLLPVMYSINAIDRISLFLIFSGLC